MPYCKTKNISVTRKGNLKRKLTGTPWDVDVLAVLEFQMHLLHLYLDEYWNVRNDFRDRNESFKILDPKTNRRTGTEWTDSGTNERTLL